MVFYVLHVAGQNRFSRACIGALRSTQTESTALAVVACLVDTET